MNHIKIIKTDQEHEQALIRLMELMDNDPVEESIENDELDLLALLIERYEEQNFPMDIPDPIDAIKFRMDQMNLKNKDLVPYLGSASKVSEVLNGQRSLSLNMIRKLVKGLGISAEVLIREPETKLAVENDTDWSSFPITEMNKRGYFGGFTGTLNELKEYAAEYISEFIGSIKNGFALQPAMLRTSAHKRSNDKEADEFAIWAWQIRVLQKASAGKLPCNYEKGTVDLLWMKKLAQLSEFDQGPLLAEEYLNKYGIHLVIETHLPKTYLDGAVCIGSDGNPVIALTMRHDKLDNFWFSLLHELAHIALHLDSTEEWYLDDMEAEGGSDAELDADSMAQEALIPASAWEALKDYSADEIAKFAKENSISPCIAAGRVRHESGVHKTFGSLYRDKVRTFFE